jgi:hypothetical protein
MEWSERVATNSSYPRFIRLIDYARRPLPGSLLQGLFFGASIAVLIFIKTLGTNVGFVLLSGVLGAAFFGLCMLPCNVWKHRRLDKGDQGQDGSDQRPERRST